MTPPVRREPSATWAAAALAVGAASFAQTFRGSPERFWQRMTRTGLLLGGAALAGDPSLRATRPRLRDLATGAGIAAALYGVFQVGDRAARVVMPHGSENIGDIYALRRIRPVPEIAARLALVIGPAEELFWRGLVCTELTERLGPVRGPATATALYGGAHVITGNPTLLGAATVAGAAWTALRAAGVPMPALIVSHMVWDVWILLVRPTE